MPCYYPLTAYQAKKDGIDPITKKRRLVFNTKEGHRFHEHQLACGQCWGCRLDRSRMWAIRCMHEFHSHKEKNCEFITLTYNPESIPIHGSLDKTHLKNFWKQLRNNNHKFKYYACGEYGDETSRPHYHAIVFGINLKDKIHNATTKKGDKLYTSNTISKLWPHGHVTIGDVTFESCAYVARYIMKKITGAISEYHYQIIDPETGYIIGSREPEFNTMSKGLGLAFYTKYKKDIYQSGMDGTIIIRGGIKCHPPRYYEEQFEKTNPQRLLEIKEERVKKAELQKWNNSRERLIVRERIALTIINKKLPRSLK